MNELTRAELIEMICPTDATYDCNQGNCSSSCDKCEDILNYLLDRYDAKVRADAIEEYFNELLNVSETARPVGWLRAQDIVTIQRARDIADRLREGKNEEQREV